MPLYRQEQEFERYGLPITRKNMADWTIACAERYLSILYDYMHQKLYEYQNPRNASHPREFLKGFQGVCIADGYQVCHAIEKERENLTISGCWAHSRRSYDEAEKALPKSTRKGNLAHKALKMIQAIC